MTTRKTITLSYDGKTVSVGWYPGTGEAAIHGAVRAALGLSADAPLVFTDADGAVVAVSDAVPDGLSLTVRFGAAALPRSAHGAAPVDAPGPRGYPLVGDIFEFVGKDGLLAPAMRLVQRHGDFMRVRIFDRYIYFCSDAEIVGEIVRREADFPKLIPDDERDPLRNLRKYTSGDGLFTSSDDEVAWQTAHRVLLPAFGSGALKQYFGKMQEVVDDLVTFLDTLPEGRAFLVTDLMTRMTYEAISYAGFNTRLGIVNDGPSHPFVDAMAVVLLDALQAAWRVLPAALRPREVKRRKQADAVLRDTVDRIIRERKEAMQRGDSVPTDLLQLMLTSRDRVTGQILSEENIRFQLITLLIAGHDTTSGLLSYALYYLATHPEVERQLLEEVDRVLGRDFSYRPQFQDLEKLELTLRVLKEALRLHPTVPALSKTPSKDVVLGGYRVPAGSEISVFLPALHRNARYWGTAAASFDPDRFLPEAVRARHPDAYHPFGTGARSCIGSQFALIEARLVLARFYQRFKARLADPSYVLRDLELLTLKPKDLHLRLERRPEERGRFPAPSASTVAGPAQPPAEVGGRSMLVLYGSNMGSSRERAELIARQAAASGLQAAVEELDARVGLLPSGTPVVIVTSTYNGLPPDNAARFAQWLSSAAPGSLRGVKFTVLGLGNRQWRTTFQKFPSFVDQRLLELGASRFHAMGVCDADSDFEAAADAWTASLWQSTKQAFAVTATAQTPSPVTSLAFEVRLAGEPSAASGHAAATMEVLRNDELQASGSGRSTRHIELALPDAIAYSAGDHLGVFPENPPEVVLAVATRCRVELTQSVVVQPRSAAAAEGIPTGVPIGVEELLSRHVDLTGPLTRRELRMLAERCACPPDVKLMETLLQEDRFKPDVLDAKLTLSELLQRTPSIECTLDLLLSMRPAMKPRYYSISSSPKVSPAACSITVGVHTADLPAGRKLRGLTSHYLSRAARGGRLRAFVKDTHSAFRLPADPSGPVILIGAGTGLAPLRGFIHERQAQRKHGLTVGPTLLFFGCRNPEVDFLYRQELQAAVHDGALTGLYPAFSRHGELPRTYVTDRIREQANALWPMVAGSACVYVCGDARRMAPDVQQAFLGVFETAGKMSRARAEAMLLEMREAGRYLEDVWAAT